MIEIEDDNEDVEDARFQAELKQALAASRVESSNRAGSSRSASGSRQNPTDTQSDIYSKPSTQLPIEASGTGVSDFLLERAQMERERLARQKRLRPDKSTTIDDEAEEDEELRGPPTKRRQISRSCGMRAVNDSTSLSSQRCVGALQVSANVSTIDQFFWNGELRQTATQHAEPRKDGKPTFRLTEVLGKVYRHLIPSPMTNGF